MQKINKLDVLKLFESAHIGVIIHAWDTSIVYANPQALSLLRLSYDQIIGKDVYDPQWHFINENFSRADIKDYPVNRVVAGERVRNQVVGVIDGSREKISWLLVNAYAEQGSDGTGFVVVTFSDVTESRQGFSFEQIVENAQDVIIVTEADEINAPLGPKIVYVNKAFEKLTGYSKEEIKGETPRILQGSLTDKIATNRIHQALAENSPVSETLLNYSKSGHPYWLDISIIPLRNRDDVVTHFAAIERDVTENRFHLEQLTKRNEDLKLLKDELKSLVRQRTEELELANERLGLLAYYDPLTKIPNRRAFNDQTSRLIHFCQRHEHIMAVGIMDVDDFKLINDKYGHDIGDNVLCKLAECLKDFFRQDDAYCRWGGEEFAFAIAAPDVSGIEQFCQRLLKEVGELNYSAVNETSFTITVSIGVCIRLPKINDSVESYIKIADKALYDAKAQGKNKVTFSKDIK